MKKCFLLTVFVSLLFMACQNSSTIIDQNKTSDQNSITISLNKQSQQEDKVDSVIVIVTAQDIDTIKSQIHVTDSTVKGSVENIPTGENRKFEVLCFDNNGNLTYSGKEYTDIKSGTTHQLDIKLYPAEDSGSVEIIGEFADSIDSESKIIFVADYEGTYDIYMTTPNGDQVKQLTSTPYDVYHPRLSPNKKKIVFSSSEGGPYLLNLKNNEIKHLSFMSDYHINCPIWSPDGTKLVFHATKDNTQEKNIYIYSFKSDNITKVVSDGIQPDWSPNGDNIVFRSPRNYSPQYTNESKTKIYKIDIDGTNLQKIETNFNYELGAQRAPHFHPDGEKVIFHSRNKYAQWGIFTDSKTIINTHGIAQTQPSWSPTGSKVVYDRTSGDDYGIYKINIEGTYKQPVVDTKANERYPHWR